MELPFSQRAVAALTERHRPTSYADVAGQESAKALLRASAIGINGDSRSRGRSVLLFGPDGAGKTCLADIYARALLCTGRVPGASEACGVCRDCDRVATGKHPNYTRLYEEELQGAGVLDAVDAVASRAWSGGCIVVLLDGADRISKDVFDALHRRIENQPAGVTFILTALSDDAVPRRIRELLLRVEVGEIGVSERERLLARVCELESISISEEAVHLLARQGSGRPRALLNHLEAMALRGPVTADEVRAHFRDPRTERALIYLERVLARASLKDQLAAMRDEGGLPPDEVGAVIQGVLTSILGAPALGFSGESLPIAFEAARARTDLGAALLQRGADLRLSARETFSRLATWWSAPIDDELGLIARMNDFDEWLNGPAPQISTGTATGDRSAPRRRRSRDELRTLAAARAAGERRRRQGQSDEYLSRTDVQRIWDAASFLIQKYGIYLSGRLSLCWGPGGQEDEADIAKAILGLQHEMRQWALRQEKPRTATADMKFHWVRVHARDSDGARWTHWGLAIRHNVDVGGWVEDYRRRPRKPLAKVMKVEWRPGPDPSQNALDRHHEVLAFLLAGIDPSWRVSFRDEAGRASDKPVRELLGVRAQRAAGRPFMKPRTAVSRYIDLGYRTKARQILSPLSVFDEGEWRRARTGWELAEHKFRVQCEADYEQRVRNFEKDWPAREVAAKERRAAEWTKLEAQWASEEKLRAAGRPGFLGTPPGTANDAGGFSAKKA